MLETEAPEPRIIKKYPNRRLYDTEVSQYITLDQIRQLVLKNEDFVVIDKRTKTDITRSILLQVIAEQEESGVPIFGKDLLTNIIRFYGEPMQQSMSQYLELSMQLFVEQQSHFKDQLRQMLNNNNPIQALKDLSDAQVPVWRKVRKEFLKNLSLKKDAAEVEKD